MEKRWGAIHIFGGGPTFVSMISAMLVNQSMTLKGALSTIESQNRTLEKRVLERTQELQVKTDHMSAILANIEEAIYIIDSVEGTFFSERSAHSESLFPGVRSIFEILAASEVTTEVLDLVRTFLICSIGEKSICFAVNKHILPKALTLNSVSTEQRKVELNFAPIINSDDCVAGVLFTARDITSIEALKAKAESQQIEASIISEIIENSPDTMSLNFRIFSRLADEALRTCEGLSQSSYIKILRHIHTIKGNARMLRLKGISSLCHQVEEKLSQNHELDERFVAARIKEIKVLVDTYVHIFEHRLNARQTKDSVVLPHPFCEVLYSRLKSMSGELSPLCEQLSRYLKNRIDGILEPLIHGLSDVSTNLGKANPNVKFIGDLEIPESYNLPIISLFTHLFRNSLDHGIENPDERTLKGKAEPGTITIHIEHRNSGIVIHYGDDGKGLDLDAIRLKAEKLQVMSPAELEALKAQDLAELIFMPMFSTKEVASEISGRGIGMDAVREMAEEMGGSIHIMLSDNVPIQQSLRSFFLIIFLPWPDGTREGLASLGSAA